MRATLRENLGPPFVGSVRATRRGLRWHRRWSMTERRWDRVRTCTAGTDHRPGVLPHTHRLEVEHDDGVLEISLRGPWGALALVELRDSIRAAAKLPPG
jgi:hypothetical protein